MSSSDKPQAVPPLTLKEATEQMNTMASMGWGNERHKNHQRYLDAVALWRKLRDAKAKAVAEDVEADFDPRDDYRK